MRLIRITTNSTEKQFYRLTGMILFVFVFLINSAAWAKQKEGRSYKIVVIDAGHGGKDPGTIVGNAREKNVVLDIALKLGKLIKQNEKNVKVIFTRDGDYYVTLMDRAQIANKANADLFISIHANYCETPSIFGTETYVLGLHRTEDNLNVAKKENSVILLEDDYTTRYEGFNPNLSESYIMFELIQDTYLEQSVRFASILQSNFKMQAQRHDREVRQAGFLVLRETAMPSVLIETGYLSNKKENSYLLTDAGRSEIAESIYVSLVKYLNKIDAKDNISVQTTRDTSGAKKNPVKSNETRPVAKTIDTPAVSAKRKDETKAVTTASHYTKEQKVTNSSTGDRTTYAIQIGVFSKQIPVDSRVFKGIAPIKELVKGGKFKYLCFEFSTLNETKAHFNDVLKLFPDAFVVSVKNNQTRLVLGGKDKK